LGEVLDFLNSEYERPPGSFTLAELTEYANDNGQEITPEALRGRLRRQAKERKVEILKVGGRTFYRIV
jgi:hypothetical protein